MIMGTPTPYLSDFNQSINKIDLRVVSGSYYQGYKFFDELGIDPEKLLSMQIQF